MKASFIHRPLLLILLGVYSFLAYGQASDYNGVVEASFLDIPALRDDKLVVNRLFKDGYHKWNKDSLLNIMLPVLWQERDSILATWDTNEEQTEASYYYAVSLLDFAANTLDAPQRDRAWKALEDTVISTSVLPVAEMLAYSPSANKYLNAYLVCQFHEVGLRYRESRDERIFVEHIGIPLDSMKTIGQNGDAFLLIPMSGQKLPKYAHERYLANQIYEWVGKSNLTVAKWIRQDLAATFPQSRLLTGCDELIRSSEVRMAASTENQNIIFVEDTDALTSLQELIAPYKGKVVYLDFWGTWCGPCITEITQHTKALKDRFKERDDLVFLYLAMDRDEDHEKWEQFIKLNSLAGYHIRKTNTAIEPIWIDLLQTENVPRTYPTYAIFGKSGQMVTNTAKRPSNGEALYQELEDVLKGGQTN